MAADSGMDTCPSPEMPDSRKRPLDGDVENGDTKRSHYGGADGTFHFKILVPSIAAGAIIGKGGETIAQLQKDAGARVKMSKANDFYPGTSERVCLITGNMEAIMNVLSFIMEKIREKPEKEFDSKNLDRDKQGGSRTQVKILVPNSTAGMIIGKGGNYIKQIKEDSGSYVQISQKARDQTLQERCITVIGEMENNRSACVMILAKVVEDPQSGSCLNVSYADMSGPVANFNPTGSPYANQSGSQTPMFSSTANLNLNSNMSTMGALLMNTAGNLNLSLNLGGPTVISNSLTTQLLDRIKVTLRASGYTDQAAGEIIGAMSTLARYGILGMGLGLAGNNSSSHFLGVNPNTAANGANNVSGAFGPIGTMTSGGGGQSPGDRYSGSEGGYDPFRRHASPNVPLNNNSFGLGTSKGEPGEQKEMEIGENIVGAILGPGGRALVEIQQYSGATIQISKKGIYAPGTRNRIVTISGQSNSIKSAQYLIEQRVHEEEAKRARNNPLGLSVQ
uniref:K Homology domain-containing protein n=1 Tax=Timema douglasi TaxID=61478 RepID=A0A7R8Z8M3_TIMDO|nr:unnamed protein product [Timema douglasi]